jgi:exodeoxyribonuclease X
MTALVLDCETSGVLEPVEVVEVAWARLRSAAELVDDEVFEQRYQPSKPIELGAMAVHHIMDEDLVGYPPSAAFKLPEDATIIIGHNVDFDHKAIGSPRVRRIDVMAMAWKAWPEIGKVSQGALLYHVERGRARELLKGAHGALQDVLNCLIALRAIAQKVGGFDTWEAMWRFSEEARIPDTFMFGKHKGTRIAETPIDYRQWFLRQADIDPYLALAIQRTL